MTPANRLLLSGGMAFVAWCSPSLAAQDPVAGNLDSRIRFIDYAPYQVTRVAGALWSSTQIEFSADEDIQHVGIGNAIAWDVAVKGNLIFLKPRELQGPTNLHVVTKRPDGSQRSYQLEIVAMSKEFLASHRELTPFYFVKFRYPADEAAKAKTAAALKADAEAATRAERVLSAEDLSGPKSYAYSAQGDAPFLPSGVSDNGKLTTFEFPDNIEVPAIFLALADGSETLVAKSVKGHSVVIHATNAKFVLRRGFEAICVFNERYVPGGTDPGTNTVSSDVSRVVKTPASIKASKGFGPVIVTPSLPPVALAPAQPAPTAPLFVPGGTLSGLSQQNGNGKP
ncbi:MAG: TrbG/VirB9 family P-type conjugative transfer protein [Hyphomicrobiaceae bacterium]